MDSGCVGGRVIQRPSSSYGVELVDGVAESSEVLVTVVFNEVTVVACADVVPYSNGTRESNGARAGLEAV